MPDWVIIAAIAVVVLLYAAYTFRPRAEGPRAPRRGLARTGAAVPKEPMISRLLENNRAWSEGRKRDDPAFFARLANQQHPEYLWIGCADSRVPANEIVGLDPGELFVHRNVANLAPPQDANYLSVLQYAVEVLKVRHILVVGHYGCGGVAAAVDGEPHGLIDHWLHPIRETCVRHAEELDACPDQKSRLDRLCELNVCRQAVNVASDVILRDAWKRGQEVAVHGWVYSLSDGLVFDLEIDIANPEQLARWRDI